METTTKKTITVETTINAPLDHVWKAWTQPEHITQWCAASDDWHAPYAENDLRKGGKFKTTMAARDGSMAFDFEGIYTKVEPNKTIEYKMSDGRNVQILFAQEGNGTRLIETFDPESQNSIELQRQGWQSILDNFRKHADKD
jgi:uncharacterized protein YndB with AHSA1/START domain